MGQMFDGKYIPDDEEKEFLKNNFDLIDGMSYNEITFDKTRLILFKRIYKLIEYCEPVLRRCSTEYKRTYINIIREDLMLMLREVNTYINSGHISHVYTIDNYAKYIDDCFRLLANFGNTCITNEVLNTVGFKTMEIGKICGGIIKSRNTKKKNKTPNGVRESKKSIINTKVYNSPLNLNNIPGPDNIISPILIDGKDANIIDNKETDKM